MCHYIMCNIFNLHILLDFTLINAGVTLGKLIVKYRCVYYDFMLFYLSK